jgi:PAS domain S-box-containing protein
MPGRTETLHFFGCKADGKFVISASNEPEGVLALSLDPVARAAPQREALLHEFRTAFIRHPRLGKKDAAIFDDITRLNNEIVNTSRELSKKNFELFLEKERNRVTIASIGDAVVATDMHGRITLMNEVAEKLTGWSHRDAVDRNVAEVVRFVAGDGRPLHDLFSSCLRDSRNATLPLDARLVRRDGASIPVDDNIAPIKDLLNSITRHDILNQTVVLVGYIDLARRKREGTDLMTYLDRMDSATDNIVKQINFTRDYQDLGVKAPEWFELSLVFAKCFQTLSPPGVRWSDGVGGYAILADPLVEKVFYNLIDNSLRHGGGVTELRLFASRAADHLLVSYEDNGVGISPPDRKRLFEKGFGKNTGLGLFLSREILAITGIAIEENGEEGKGARFVMDMPPGHFRPAIP